MYKVYIGMLYTSKGLHEAYNPLQYIMANLTSELEAVNTILSTTGQAPVNSLSTSRSDVRIAQNLIDEASREVQLQGWNFNTEYDVELSTDTSDEITLPVNILRFDLNREYRGQIRPVMRGTRLYDVKKRRYTFPDHDMLKATVIYLLEFTELPEAARRYITVKAARMYQQRFLGADELIRYSAQDEMKAKSDLLRHETDTGNYTIFDEYGRRTTDNRYRNWRR